MVYVYSLLAFALAVAFVKLKKDFIDEYLKAYQEVATQVLSKQTYKEFAVEVCRGFKLLFTRQFLEGLRVLSYWVVVIVLFTFHTVLSTTLYILRLVIK